MIFSRNDGYPTDVGTASQLEDMLRHHGLRPTRQRLAVLAVLARERNDATAQGIYASLTRRGEHVGLATVYRTLAALNGCGVVDALMHNPGEVCYRLCGPGHHHHLVCDACHRVVELVDCDLDAWLAERAADHGFTVSGHTVEVSGTCADCRAIV
jgi:Fur family ferric uptake transcriptional regulator